MSYASTANALPVDQREQPFLYTWNRRLRHLHGISLRNLNLSAASGRARGKTIVDDEYILRTPAKSVAQREIRTLHHARSYDQISKAAESAIESPLRASAGPRDQQLSPRRPNTTLRRRSTLHWATSNPRSRQIKLEDVENDRLVASWFSLHHHSCQEPIYISEVMESCMNPSFSSFDLDAAASEILGSTELMLRIWAKNESSTEFRLLVELKVDLRSLQFIGKSLEHFHHPLPENCILLHLSDGIYTSFTDLPADEVHQPAATAAMKALGQSQTTPFETLLKLANLDKVVQDALRTQAKIEASIGELLAKTSNAEVALSQLAGHRESLKTVQHYRDSEHKLLEQMRKNKVEQRRLLISGRETLHTLPTKQLEAERHAANLSAASQTIRDDIKSLDDKSLAQLRRICTNLSTVFPIEPVKNRTLQFTIRGIHLPNSSFNDTNRDEIAAALEFVAQLVFRLALYLSVPLPYPIELGEPVTLISDTVSAGIAQRRFSLQPSAPAYKFEYGVFLLNKNVEFLLARTGLRVMDIRHTLPNLKYLMFVLTAGTGEVPERKGGGIPGLLRGFAPSMSRRNSDDSAVSQTGRAAIDHKRPSLAQSEKSEGVDDSFHGSFRAKGLPYRRSTLRDIE